MLDGIAQSVNIGRNVWIGANAVVLKGVNIGDNAVIGAGSIVTHDVPKDEIWVGNPARYLRKRDL
jgi:maltose O-acetyltransferase